VNVGGRRFVAHCGRMSAPEVVRVVWKGGAAAVMCWCGCWMLVFVWDHKIHLGLLLSYVCVCC
jgi:hypothetical protein